MKKIIIFMLFAFLPFTNVVKAVVTCDANRKSDTEVTFNIYDTSDTEHDGTSVLLKLDASTNKISTLKVCDELIIKSGNNISDYNLLSKKSFSCIVGASGNYTVNFEGINLAEKFYAFTNNVTCGISYPSSINITGLKNAPEEASSNSVFCSGANYNFIVRKGEDNQAQCNVTIRQDKSGGDVIMKHGSQTSTNPKAGKYICETPVGDRIEFYLGKNLDKGSLKSPSDCPSLQALSGTDGKQAEIENPVKKPEENEDSTSSNNSNEELNNEGNHTIPNLNCTSLLGDPTKKNPPSPAYLLSFAFKIIRYIALIIFVVMSTMDFIESVSSQDKDSINKAVNKLIQRAIICVVLFLLPSIIEFVLTFLNDRAVNICINT